MEEEEEEEEEEEVEVRGHEREYTMLGLYHDVE